VLGPVVVLTSLAVLGTGVALALAGRETGPWLFLHKASFVLWFGAMTLHVLTYAWRLPRILLSTHAAAARPARNGSRLLLVGGSPWAAAWSSPCWPCAWPQAGLPGPPAGEAVTRPAARRRCGCRPPSRPVRARLRRR
jgi:hypothetical protein